MKKSLKPLDKQIAVYQTKSGAIELRRDSERETIWATQAQIAEIFGVNPQAITKHLKNIYRERELSKKATCSKMEQVQSEGNRTVRRTLETYNLDTIISIGYRINSKLGTKFRQWATKTLRTYVTDGYVINRSRIKENYDAFLRSVTEVQRLLPSESKVDTHDVLELITLFSDTWLSLDAYDKGQFIGSGTVERDIEMTGDQLVRILKEFKSELLKKGEISDLFGTEKQEGSVHAIVGNVMQTFGANPVYPTVEEKAAYLLYFMVKDHPFVDGNKRSGAYAFIWFLQKAGLLAKSKITPPALTALTLLVAESEPKNKGRMIKLMIQLLKNI